MAGLGDFLAGSGKFEKLKIIACADNKYEHEKAGADDKMEVLYNPEKLEESIAISYDGARLAGSSKDKQKFNRAESGDIVMSFLIDGTGASKGSDGKQKDVVKEISKFRKMTFDLDGDKHEPKHVVLSWGEILIKGRLKSAKFTYTLFNPAGKPLRATVLVTLVRSHSDMYKVLGANKSSPDLTHFRTVQAGDTLPLMTKKIYGKTDYYLEVARINKLKNFTNLKPGDSIYFPPLDKTT